MKEPFFTIFTPVYNGEKHLYRVFESIKNQAFKDFEWIVINDGSKDNSENLINEFKLAHPEIDLIYIEQPNSGKHIAWNKAVSLGRGKLFVPADSDDYFFPHTLSFFFEHWSALDIKDQKNISGINVLCFDNDLNEIVGTLFPGNGMKTNNLELEYKYRITGEKWGCIRLDLLKTRPFPIVKHSHFPESYLWLYFAKHFQVVCFNEPLRRYYTTKTGIIQTYKAKKDANNAKVIIRYNLWFLRNFGTYVAWHSPKDIKNKLKEIASSILVLLALKR